MAAKVNKEKCTACGTCIDSCPIEAIKMKEKAEIDENECVDCGTCVDECPEGAIELD